MASVKNALKSGIKFRTKKNKKVQKARSPESNEEPGEEENKIRRRHKDGEDTGARFPWEGAKSFKRVTGRPVPKIVNFDDEESGWADVTEDPSQDAPTPPERRATWDLFNAGEHDETSSVAGVKATKIFLKCFKVLLIVLTFVFLFVAVFFSKATLLYATSSLKSQSDLQLQCQDYQQLTLVNNDNVTNREISQFSRCVSIPRTANLSEDYICIQSNTGNNVTRLGGLYVGDECEILRVRWLWCLVLMLVTPNLLMFFRSFLRACFKKTLTPSAKLFLVVTLIEVLQVFGLCIFVYVVLPSLDSVILGVGVMTGLPIIPAILNILNRGSQKKCRILTFVLDIAVFVILLVTLVVVLVWQRASSDVLWGLPLSAFLISLPVRG